MDVTGFLKGLSYFVWPGIFVFVAWRFRDEIGSILSLVRQQIASGAAIKLRYFEFKGLDIRSFDSRDGTGYRQELADEELYFQREDNYKQNKNLFLVHRVLTTGKKHSKNKLPTFDISVYLVGHKNFGKINDVKRVEYYFGRYFGLEHDRFGTKYVVENGTDGFAVRNNAYGPMLCEARIVFHDGSETTMSRYLDFEGTDYRFNASVLDADKTKLRRRSSTETDAGTEAQDTETSTSPAPRSRRSVSPQPSVPVEASNADG
jgi:hypothetical protein